MQTTSTRLDWREGRRRRAWELKQAGWKQQDIAAALGVTPGAVSQWLKRARVEGVEGLRRHPAPGRQPRLTTEQVAQLPALLERGAQAADVHLLAQRRPGERDGAGGVQIPCPSG
jgi:transposase